MRRIAAFFLLANLSPLSLALSWETIELRNQECARQFQTSNLGELERVQALSECLGKVTEADGQDAVPGHVVGEDVSGGKYQNQPPMVRACFDPPC